VDQTTKSWTGKDEIKYNFYDYDDSYSEKQSKLGYNFNGSNPKIQHYEHLIAEFWFENTFSKRTYMLVYQDALIGFLQEGFVNLTPVVIIGYLIFRYFISGYISYIF
jgi:hypothetical protein